MRSILKQSSKEQLIEFILEYADKDEKFANAVRVRFAEPELDKDLSRIAGELNNRFEDVSHFVHGGGRRCQRCLCGN